MPMAPVQHSIHVAAFVERLSREPEIMQRPRKKRRFWEANIACGKVACTGTRSTILPHFLQQVSEYQKF